MICASYGEVVPEDFSFCGRCGSPVATTAGQSRKPATLLFCDVLGSTALAERLDAEAVRELMLDYYREARASIEHHGGTVEKFVGDAVLAVFGVPEAHEDDPLRACRAALEIQQRLDPEPADLGSDHLRANVDGIGYQAPLNPQSLMTARSEYDGGS